MGTILARAIIVKAQRIIQDADGIRWPLDEMLGWLNGGQREVALLRPDATSVTISVQLAAGTKQACPANAWRVLDVIRNTGPSGDVPGRAIRFCEREVLDSQHPDWHSYQPNAAVKNWTYDEREPKTFYAFPPQPSTGRGYVDLVVSRSPIDCTLDGVLDTAGAVSTVDSVISIDDVFENPLIDWTVYRAHLKEAKYAMTGKADASYARFMNSLGIKIETDKRFAARRNAPPHVNPNVPGNTGALGD